MKRCFIFLLLISSLAMYSQETSAKLSPEFKRNELKLNALFLLFEGVEFSYERALNYDCSIGGSSLIFTYKDSDLDSGMNYNVTAFGRYYFGKKPVSGFFGEVFTTFLNRDYFVDDHPRAYRSRRQTETNIAFGLSLGVKWIRNRFTFELSSGMGRIPRSASDDYTPFIGRGALAIGYRF
ncbi:DUF3575 domain-containing protein [Capnocytophaga stomatis]|nr:DUF3575 domain-containing protein [Capnocytophaga stomatis]